MANRTLDELYLDVASTNWHIAEVARSSFGVRLTFVKNHTSLFPGAETKVFIGKDESEAMRKFLAEMGK